MTEQVSQAIVGTRRSNVRRAFREDLAQIDASIAEALNKQYGGDSRRIAMRCYHTVKRRAPFFAVDFDLEDLIAVADAALLEAWVAYRDGDASRDRTDSGDFSAGFTMHVRRVIYWRLRDYVEGLQSSVPPSTARCDIAEGAHEPAIFDVEVIFQNQELRVWLRSALRTLRVRERAIVTGVAQGSSFRELGIELGLSYMTVSRYYHQALKRLRTLARAHFGEELSE